MSVLDKLWNGEIRPCDKCVRKGSQYEKLLRDFTAHVDQILKALPKDQKSRLSPLLALSADLQEIESHEAFTYGFRLGAATILDVISGNHGDFEYISESDP